MLLEIRSRRIHGTWPMIRAHAAVTSATVAEIVVEKDGVEAS